MKQEEERCDGAIPQLGIKKYPDSVRIKEINEAIKDETGEQAKKLIVKYEENKYIRRVLREVLW